MKKTTIIMTVALAFLAMPTFSSCELSSNNSNTRSSLASSATDGEANARARLNRCRGDFENLCNNTFSSADAAISAIENFVNRYSDINHDYTEDAYEMKFAFKDMQSFFNQTFSSYYYFKQLTNDKSNTYTSSSFPVIRNSWPRILDNETDRILRRFLSEITAETFDPYLRKRVKQIVEEDYDHERAFGWDITRIDRVSIEEPKQVEGLAAKETEAVYRVHLKGNTLGWDTGTLKIQVKGRLGFSEESGDLYYNNLDYNYLERSSKL